MSRRTQSRPRRVPPIARPTGITALPAAVLTAVLLTACTPPGLPPPVSPSATVETRETTDPAGGDDVRQLTIGLDGVLRGFNPHAMADFSAGTRAVAALVLPSTTVIHADGTTGPDRDLLDSAELTSTEPYTVTYTLNVDAAWSDGTPITAEDFVYLHQQMLVQPGTVDPAGYRQIAEIRARDAGKVVDVEFVAPFPDWPTLFSPLLPAHILKDAPGGWADGLDTGIPVSAGRYKLDSVDPVTGEIRLVRNDKYWGDGPGPQLVVLRIGTYSELLEALDRGDVQAVLGDPAAGAHRQLQQDVPEERWVEVPLPATVQLVFNTTAGPAADPAVRRAIAAGLDLATLRVDLTGGLPATSLPVSSQVTLPAQDTGGQGPPVVTADAAAARAMLAATGYNVSGLYASRAGEVLRLTLAYPSGEPGASAAARSLQAQLGLTGIEVDLLADDPGALIADRIATGQFDLALVTVPRGPSDVTTAASQFGCGDLVDPDTPRTGNLSGYCSAATERVFTAALAGGSGVGSVDSVLWRDLPVLPIGEPTTVLAVSEELHQVVADARPGWLWSGPLAGLSDWPTP